MFFFGNFSCTIWPVNWTWHTEIVNKILHSRVKVMSHRGEASVKRDRKVCDICSINDFCPHLTIPQGSILGLYDHCYSYYMLMTSKIHLPYMILSWHDVCRCHQPFHAHSDIQKLIFSMINEEVLINGLLQTSFLLMLKNKIFLFP